MAKKTSKNSKPKDSEIDAEIQRSMNEPWMKMRTGLIVMAVASIFIIIFIAWQLVPSEGLLKGIAWGIAFGGSMWLIFFAGIWFNRFMRRGQK